MNPHYQGTCNGPPRLFLNRFSEIDPPNQQPMDPSKDLRTDTPLPPIGPLNDVETPKGHTKGQSISKQNCQAVTSTKK